VGLHRSQPGEVADPPRVLKYRVEPLTQTEAQAVLEAVQQHRLAALYSVGLAIGLRLGEALGLRWEDVDLERGTLLVRQALQRIDGEWRFVEPKTEQSRRVIPLPAVAVAALKAHRDRQTWERKAAEKGEGWHETGLVFCAPDGSPQFAQNITRTFQGLLVRAGLKPRRFHDLRHACCSLLLAQGVPPGTVMEILGHSNIQTTMMIYREVTQDAKRQGIAKLDFLTLDPQTTVVNTVVNPRIRG